MKPYKFDQFAEDIDPIKRELLQQHAQATLDRLAHLEFNLMFKGRASRYDLISRFGTASAQATKDFACYRKVAPENMLYDPKMRINYRGDKFKPLFYFDIEKVLSSITLGYGDGFGRTVTAFDGMVEGSTTLVKPSLDILAKICEAIYHESPLRIKYISSSSANKKEEEKWRVVVPHTVVNSTLKWHVRGFDRKTNEFRDFILTRIVEAEVLLVDKIKEIRPTTRECREYDHDWNRIITLKLRAHPALKNQEIARLDCGIPEGEEFREVQIRAAIAPYFLRAWNVDCRQQKLKDNNGEILFALENVDVLKTISNAKIAPTGDDYKDDDFTVITKLTQADEKNIEARKKARKAALKQLSKDAKTKMESIPALFNIGMINN